MNASRCSINAALHNLATAADRIETEEMKAAAQAAAAKIKEINKTAIEDADIGAILRVASEATAIAPRRAIQRREALLEVVSSIFQEHAPLY